MKKVPAANPKRCRFSIATKYRMCYRRMLLMIKSKFFSLPDLKTLVVVVECSKALVSSWHNILSDYIVRSFCGNEATNAAGPDIQLTLMELNRPMIKKFPHGWICNVEHFLAWLHNLEFTDVEFPDVAIAEGLRKLSFEDLSFPKWRPK
uniref:mediator of RNA polymerase II transcription subunit 25-like isoform X2 n=1 Tax=Erigeron canadensis TaxID=72917 RepID=UPI001CB94F4F|nr:mediator of RNA polymerase II transcription subunit 25-like isoform X2 [Erigeron canadensis]